MDETLFDPIIGHRRLKAKLARLIDEDRLPIKKYLNNLLY